MTEEWQGRGELLLSPEAEALFKDLGIASAADADAFTGGEELRRRAETSILRFEHAGQIYYLKRFHYDALAVALRSAVKFNAPVRSGLTERANLLALAAEGFRVPRPIAAGFGGPLRARRSFVLLEEMPGATLEEMIQGQELDDRAWRSIGRDLGGLIARFHAAGFWHRDLYLCHISFHPKQGLGILDGERVKRRSPLPLRWRIKDLAALDYSSRGQVPNSARGAFWRAYQGEESWLSRISAKRERIARHDKGG